MGMPAGRGGRRTMENLQTGLLPGQPQGGPAGYFPRRHVFTLCGFGAVTVGMLAGVISLAVVPICKELGWDNATKGVVLSAFFYGYAPCCAVGGALALHFNRPTAQIFLLPLVVAASLMAALPTLVLRLHNVPCFGRESCSEVGMFAVMVVMGMVQATLNPALHRMISVWSPVSERSLQHNLIYSGQRATARHFSPRFHFSAYFAPSGWR